MIEAVRNSPLSPEPRHEAESEPATVAEDAPRHDGEEPKPLPVRPRFAPLPADTTARPAIPAADTTAPIKPTINLAPIARPNLAVDPGAALGMVSGNARGHVRANSSGRIGPLRIREGLNVDANVEVRNGVPVSGGARFSRDNGRHQSVPVLGPVVGVSGVAIADRRLKAKIRVLGLDLVSYNATSQVFKGHSRIPADAATLARALGLDAPANRTANADPLAMFDVAGATLDADFELASSNGRMVSFGEGLALDIRDGSRIKLTRANGRNTLELDVDVGGARIGGAEGTRLTVGPSRLHILAEETKVDGKSVWSVKLLGGGGLTDVRVSTPEAGTLSFGNIAGASVNGQPVVSLEGSDLRVRIDGRVERIQGALALRDTSGRKAQLEIGANGAPTTISTRLEIDADISGAHPPRHVLLSGSTQGLRVAVNAPEGVQAAAGGGTAVSIANGTQLSGGGTFTYALDEGAVQSFVVSSPEGFNAELVLRDATIARRLGDIGARVALGDGARIGARVRSIDWASGVADFSVKANADIDSAQFIARTGENATLVNALASAEMDVRIPGHGQTPNVRGVLRFATEAPGSGQSTGIEFLPESVSGFDRGGSGGITARLEPGARMSLVVPFTLDERGARTENGSLKHAVVDGENLDITTSFETDGARDANLPALLDASAMTAALARDAERRARITRTPLPSLVPLADAPARLETKPLVDALTAPAAIFTALNDLDLEITSRSGDEEFVRRLSNGLGGVLLTVDLSVAPATQLHLLLESEGGEIRNQGPVRPGGGANPNAGKPSRITFNPPAKLIIDAPPDWLGGRNGGAIVELNGLDILPVAGQPGRLRFEPILGNTTGREGGLARLLGDRLLGNRWFAREVANGLAKELFQTKTMPENTAAFVAALKPVLFPPPRPANEPPRRPGPFKSLLTPVKANLQLVARGTLKDDVRIELPGNNAIGLGRGNAITVAHGPGSTQFGGNVALGPTRLDIGGDVLSFDGGRARFSVSTQRGSGSTYALNDLQADGLNVTAVTQSGKLVVRDGRLRQGDISLRSADDRLSYTATLDDLSVREVALTTRAGGTVNVSGIGRDGRASVKRVEIAPTGAISVAGVSGRFAANGVMGESRYRVARADVVNGNLDLSPSGSLTTGRLALRNVAMTVTNIDIPPGGRGPLAVHLDRVDAAAPALTLSISSRNGYHVTTPANAPAEMVATGSGTFRLPSPDMEVHARDGSASGKLVSLRIDPRNRREDIVIDDWVMRGTGSGTLAAGPSGSLTSNLRLGDNPVQLYVDRLRYQSGSGNARVDARAYFRAIDMKAAIPQVSASAAISGRGDALATIDVSAAVAGPEARARSHAHIDRVHLEVDARRDAKRATESVQGAARHLQRQFGSTPN